MVSLATIKKILKHLHLQRFANWLVKVYATLRPHQICKRDGIWYHLDLSELIDYSIFIGGWEKTTIDFLSRTVTSGNCVLEIGANIGAHTLQIAQLVGPTGCVYAFEPTDYAANKLAANIKLNPELALRIRVRGELATNSERETSSTIILSSWKRSESKEQRPTESVQPELISIDELVETEEIKRIDPVKIDMDGYDFKVLQGANNTGKCMSRVIFIKLCGYYLNTQEDSVREILAFLFNAECDLNSNMKAA